jgi:hypothetical protein
MIADYHGLTVNHLISIQGQEVERIIQGGKLKKRGHGIIL